MIHHPNPSYSFSQDSVARSNSILFRLRKSLAGDRILCVSESQGIAPGGLPHNPAVRELVANKRRFSSPPKREQAIKGFLGWHERGFLPHRDEPGLLQFVTFRLADSFPEALRSEWEHLWEIEDNQQRRKQLQSYLDKGRGNCHLGESEVAKIVQDTLIYFNKTRYDLLAWCIMPNHVHVLFKTTDATMSAIIHTWKRHSAFDANRWLGRKGAFWASDYWDTFMRNSTQERATIRYIETNPARARLILDPRCWPWSSAHFRNQYGALVL
jgi:REP element-mobilizing transposase RayT